MDTKKEIPILTTEEEMLRFVMDSSHEMVLLSDSENWEMRYANRPALDFAAHRGEDYHGKPCYWYMMGKESPCPFCPQLVKESPIPQASEVDNGKQVYAVHTRQVRWKGKEAFMESVSDITELRRSRRIFESQMHTLLASLADATGVVHLDVTGNRCISKGGAVKVMERLPEDKAICEILHHIVEFIPDMVARKEIYETFSRKAMLAAYEEGKVEIVKDMESTSGGKGMTHVRLTGRLLMNPENSHLECILYGRDITKRILAQKKQEEKEKEQLSIFYGLSRDFRNVYLLSLQTERVSVLKMDGYIMPGLSHDTTISYPYTETTLRYIKTRVYAEDQEQMKQVFSLAAIKKALQTSSEYTGTYRVQNEGKPCYFQYRYIHLGKEGKVIMAFRNVNALFIEEQKKQKQLADALEKAKQSNIAKTTFLNSMSHDIRTPLNAILGFTALAMNHLGQEHLLEDHLNKIALAGNHLLVLINDVLDMSRIESGTTKLAEETVYLPQLLEDMRVLMLNDISAKEQILHWDIGNLPYPYVILDPMKVKKVLLNMLSNAVKFTREGGCVRLAVTEEANQQTGYAQLCFSIQDSGIGMKEEYVKHIFEPFSREETSTISGIPGTGLGLAIAKHMVDMMGGTIEVKTRRGKGSRFNVHLPCRLTPAPAEEKEKSSMLPIIHKEKGDCHHILLVEDNELNQEIGKEILQLAGFEVELAENGLIAYEKIARSQPGKYDLVLMDIQMPVMDGYEATRKIRKLPLSYLSKIPIVALTANAFEEDKEKAFRAGMNGHLAKPINIPELLKTVRSIV